MEKKDIYKALVLPIFCIGYWGTAILVQGIDYEIVKWASTSLIITSLGTLFWHFQFGEWPIESAENLYLSAKSEDV